MELERDIGGRSNHLCIVLLHETMPTMVDLAAHDTTFLSGR